MSWRAPKGRLTRRAGFGRFGGAAAAVAILASSAILGAAQPSQATVPSWSVGASYPAIPLGVSSLSCPSTAVCDATATTSSNSSIILGTADGGSSWSTLDAPTAAAAQIQGSDVVCPSTTVCEAAGWVDASGDAVMFRTTDGGVTWSPQTVTGSSTISNLVCPSTTVCEAVGSGLSNVVLGTTDGGTTWASQTLPIGLNGPVVDLACASTTVCEASTAPSGVSGEAVQILGTTDGGTSWGLQSVTANVVSPSGVSLVCPSTTSCEGLGAIQLLTGDPVVLTTTDGGSTWNSQTLPAGVDSVGDLVCPSSAVCEASGEISVAGSSAGPVMVRTTDGGSTWSLQPLPASVEYVGILACPSTTVCEASASNAIFGSPEMVGTTDGGSTWSTQTLPQAPVDAYPSTVLVCASTAACETSVNGSVAGTDDGGATWTAQSLSSGAVPTGEVTCADASVCAALGSDSSGNSVVFITTDGGNSWSIRPMPRGIGVAGIVCPSAQVCVAAGVDSTGDGVTVRTDDGGNTWTTQPLPQSVQAFGADSLVCPSTTVCEMAGYDQNSNELFVFGTTDGGSTWNTQQVPSDIELTSLVCPSTTTCEAAGYYNFNDEPAMFGTTNGGMTWQQQTLPASVEEVLALACPSTTMCQAVGEVSSGTSFVAFGTIDTGSAWNVEALPSGAGFDGFWLVCPSTSACRATGYDDSSGDPEVLSTNNGGSNWTAQTLPSTVNVVTSLVCPSTTVCEAVGADIATNTEVMIGTANGGSTWGTQALPAGILYVDSVVCPSAAACEASASTATASDLLDYSSGPQPLGVTTANLSVGSIGSSYQQWVGASGGDGPYTWSVASGSLPDGLHLDGSTGAITGTPTTAGTADFTLQVTDSESSPATVTSGTLSITIDQSSAYTAVNPYRICDTRGADGLVGTNAHCAGQPLTAGGTLAVQVSGTNPSGTSTDGVPASGVVAVVLNVTATGESSQGYLTMWPSDASRPTASSLNYQANKTVPNLVTVGLSASGQVSFYSLKATNLVVDVEGYYSAPTGTAGLFNSVTPYRICDTRSTAGLVGTNAQCAGHTMSSGQTLTLQVSGTNPSGTSTGGVPSSGVSAVILNVTAIGHGTGYLTVFPQGVSAPTASNLNFSSGQVVPNRVIVPVSASGQVSLTTNTSVDVVVDVNGWFTDGSSPAQTGALFVATTPSRICDTRSDGNSTPCAGYAVFSPAPDDPLEVAVAGQGPVPASGVVAVVANVTATDTTATSYLTAWPTGQTRPTASDLNWVAGLTVPNMAVVGLGTGGDMNVYVNSGGADVLVDVTGWYVEESS